MNRQDSIIRAKGLSRIYNLGETRVVGLDNVDLTVEPGAFIALKGASGSGKSTLLGLLAGLDQATHGELVIAGHDLRKAGQAELTRYRRNVVGMVFQAFNLLPTLTVVENIELPALLAGRPAKPSRLKALELIDWLGMTPRKDHRPAQLSGGEMQRAAIARALVNDPAIILADEPTGNLDSANGQAVIELLSLLNKNSHRTLIVATHSGIVDHLATCQIFLNDGRIDRIL